MFDENVLLAHLLVATWYASFLGEPPALGPVQFVCEVDHVNKPVSSEHAWNFSICTFVSQNSPVEG